MKWDIDRKKNGEREWEKQKERKELFMFILSICYKITSQVWMKLLGPPLAEPGSPASAGERERLSLALLLMYRAALGPSHTDTTKLSI